MTSFIKRLLAIALICNLLISVCFVPVNAEGKPKANFSKIDNYIKTAMKDSGIPGISLGIVEGNKVIYLKGYGKARSDIPVTPKTVFHTGSIAKTFTALAIRQLANEGKIDYDAPVQKYIPWFHEGKKDNPQITIDNLINHASGYSRAQGNSDFIFDGRYSIEDEVKKISSMDPENSVGTEEYSNINFIILGLVIEKVTGESYEIYIRENILKPLDMNNTYFSDKEASSHDYAEGHKEIFGFLLPHKYMMFPKGAVPAGFYLSSAEDMSHYLIAYLNNGYYNGKSIIPNNTLRAAASNTDTPNHCYSIYWNPTISPGDLFHTGADQYFYTGLKVSPILNYGIILFTNARNDNLTPWITAEQITNGVMDILSNVEPAPLDKASHYKNFLELDIQYLFIGLIILFLLFRLINFKKRMNASKRSFAFHVSIYLFVNIVIPLSLLLYEIFVVKTDFTKIVYHFVLYGMDYNSLLFIYMFLFLVVAIVKGFMFSTIRKNIKKKETLSS